MHSNLTQTRTEKLDYQWHSLSLGVMLLVTFCINLIYSLVGWQNPLIDSHPFRQTQTAISAFYFLKQGFTLEYQTPVMGAPWSLPMEFPTYQIIVAGLVKILHTPLDQTGRAVSLGCFYAGIILLFATIRAVTKTIVLPIIVTCLILLNPIYLFWSRTFMIESTTFFLGCLSLWSLYRSRSNSRYVWVFFLASILAGLTKITTYVLFIPFFVLMGWTLIPKKQKWLITAAIGLSLGASILWVRYADTVKSRNALARTSITSSALRKWNFGTYTQKTNPLVWKQILLNTNIFPYKINPFLVSCLLVASIFLFNLHYKKAILICCLCYLLGPLIFTNLYLKHDYYSYANSFFLCLGLGIWLYAFGLKSQIGMKLVIYLFLPLTLGFFFKQYLHAYEYFQQTSKTSPEYELATFLKSRTQEADVLLLYGFDWSAEVPYYAQRKAIMDNQNRSLWLPNMREVLTTTGLDQIRAVVFNTQKESVNNPQFINDKVVSLGFTQSPLIYKQFLVYVKN